MAFNHELKKVKTFRSLVLDSVSKMLGEYLLLPTVFTREILLVFMCMHSSKSSRFKPQDKIDNTKPGSPKESNSKLRKKKDCELH